MKKSTVGILAALAAVSVAATANAQTGPTTPFSFNVNAGAALPTGDFGDLVSTGWTVGVDGTFNITPMFGIYAGYSVSQFGLSDDAEELFGEGDVTEQGFDAGIKATFGGGTLPFTPFLRGGLIFHKLGADFEDDDEDVEDSDSELGFEIGGGITFPLGPRISVVPSASYLQWTPEEDGEESIDVSQVKVQIGLNIRI
ncbi:MAG TPA: outer membrane beta-barrel protein [Longimicrobium sp.]|nr:outer membrane beta-barrel protein [Longimicrobium sp.]